MLACWPRLAHVRVCLTQTRVQTLARLLLDICLPTLFLGQRWQFADAHAASDALRFAPLCQAGEVTFVHKFDDSCPI
jgi:hypothetical protein